MMIVRGWRAGLVVATVIGVSYCAVMRRQEARETGDILVAAGFQTKPADTPERVQQLDAIPALKIVSQSKDGHVVYHYADPYACQCLYVGDEDAYGRYKRLALQKQVTEERLQAAEAEEGAAIDWSLWGPWWW
jgi:hypothetical protein